MPKGSNANGTRQSCKHVGVKESAYMEGEL